MAVPSHVRRLGLAAPLLAAILAAGPAAAPAFAYGEDLDRMIGIMNADVPAEFATPAPVTVVSTGIDCYTLPCPYWAVEDATGTLLIGVEDVVASPDDAGIALVEQLWKLLEANGYQPIQVEGYVIDRPRLRGSPEFQRVLVVTAGPDGLLQP
jgi:hypothetical protein